MIYKKRGRERGQRSRKDTSSGSQGDPQNSSSDELVADKTLGWVHMKKNSGCYLGKLGLNFYANECPEFQALLIQMRHQSS